ncbi:hypothetical protein O6H91_10G021300 [Diphasiastrum complanatum]|uniref:Uncharacterized protein n=1 Tax=Diphasiastrum complanatum TaxID=34168 RepID=A0ACC2CFU3_DIPCM|nr:hypothetical protein O6H91_10G021300 [Diphasiastrum complanatum]
MEWRAKLDIIRRTDLKSLIKPPETSQVLLQDEAEKDRSSIPAILNMYAKGKPSLTTISPHAAIENQILQYVSQPTDFAECTNVDAKRIEMESLSLGERVVNHQRKHSVFQPADFQIPPGQPQI